MFIDSFIRNSSPEKQTIRKWIYLKDQILYTHFYSINYGFYTPLTIYYILPSRAEETSKLVEDFHMKQLYTTIFTSYIGKYIVESR